MRTDPREQIRMAVFDLFGETNSMCKQDLTTGHGQRSSRVSLRRIELSLQKLDELTVKMRAYIQHAETEGL